MLEFEESVCEHFLPPRKNIVCQESINVECSGKNTLLFWCEYGRGINTQALFRCLMVIVQ